MIRMRGILIAALFALFGTGCFEVEQSIELKRDLSGTANFKLGIDMEPMITIMAKVQKEMGGDKSPLTKAEIDAAKAEFKKSAKKTASAATEDCGCRSSNRPRRSARRSRRRPRLAAGQDRSCRQRR